MKAIIFLFVTLLFMVPAFADTYTGVTSGIKHFPKRGIAVDMDGRYPNQKMTLYMQSKNEADVVAVICVQDSPDPGFVDISAIHCLGVAEDYFTP
jgi:hypothetical protein